MIELPKSLGKAEFRPNVSINWYAKMNNLKYFRTDFSQGFTDSLPPIKEYCQVISAQVESGKTKRRNTSQTCWVAPNPARDLQRPRMHGALFGQDISPTPPTLLAVFALYLLLEPACSPAPWPAPSSARCLLRLPQPCHGKVRASRACMWHMKTSPNPHSS